MGKISSTVGTKEAQTFVVFVTNLSGGAGARKTTGRLEWKKWPDTVIMEVLQCYNTIGYSSLTMA